MAAGAVYLRHTAHLCGGCGGRACVWPDTHGGAGALGGRSVEPAGFRHADGAGAGMRQHAGCGAGREARHRRPGASAADSCGGNSAGDGGVGGGLLAQLGLRPHRGRHLRQGHSAAAAWCRLPSADSVGL